MRLTGGYLKGRTFYPPADKWPTRPTTDIAREALFNILSNFIDYDGIRMLDIFGGSGAHSYEMISRGCNDVVYVDHFAPCIQFVKKTVVEFIIQDKIKIVLSDYEKFLLMGTKPFNYIFAGPPYPLKNLDQIPEKIFKSNLLASDGFFVLEHNQEYTFIDRPGFWQVRNYGQTHFSFFKPLDGNSL
jgi:16S rRNA (guanine(966)-N(2))-methyltransferase RsmD